VVLVDILDVFSAVPLHEHSVLLLDFSHFIDLLALLLVVDVYAFQQVLVFGLLLHYFKRPSRVFLNFLLDVIDHILVLLLPSNESLLLG